MEMDQKIERISVLFINTLGTYLRVHSQTKTYIGTCMHTSIAYAELICLHDKKRIKRMKNVYFNIRYRLSAPIKVQQTLDKCVLGIFFIIASQQQMLKNRMPQYQQKCIYCVYSSGQLAMQLGSYVCMQYVPKTTLTGVD